MAVEGPVRLGVIESMQPVLLPGTIRFLRERYPGLAVRPVRGRSAGLTDAVKAGSLDAAVVAQPEKGGLSSCAGTLLARELVLVAPPTTEYGLSRRPVPPARLDPLRPQHRHRRAWRCASSTPTCPRSGRALEFDSVPAIVAMVSAGLGISVVQLSDHGICLAYPVRIVPLGRHAPRLRMSLVMRKADEDDRRLKALREAMEATLAARDRRARTV